MIENYKDLIRTIILSDQDEGRLNSVICVYDTLDSDKLIAIFNTSKTCADFFKTSYKCIQCDICRKTLRLRRYRLERVKLWWKN